MLIEKTDIAQSLSSQIKEKIFWLPVVLAAFVPFVNFAAENVGESISVIALLKYATSVGGIALIFLLIWAPLGRAAISRIAFAVSVFVFLFFSFPAVQRITGTSGVILHIIYSTLTLFACCVAWFLARYRLAWRAWLAALFVMLIVPSGSYVLRLVRLESSDKTEREISLAKSKVRISKMKRFEYPSVGTISSVLSCDPNIATPNDGAAFLGYDFIPSTSHSVLRVHVTANIYSADENLAVLAIFRNGTQAPVNLQCAPISAGGRAMFDVMADVPVIEGEPVGLVVRAGPGKPGTVVINGPNLASKPQNVPLPAMTIEELKDPPITISIKHPRNVYYLTLDGYVRADSLREGFDFDNSDFINFLTSNGFRVGEKSRVNYPLTYLSVSATLEQSFVADESEINVWNKMPWFLEKINGKNRVFKRFQDLGYFVAKLNFREECIKSGYVDFCYGDNRQQERIDLRLSELEFSLLQLTPIYDLLANHFVGFFHRHLSIKDMDDVIAMIKYLQAPEPKFFYSHIFLPHPPYRFSADCSPSKTIDAHLDESMPKSKMQFLDQTLCANKKSKELVEYVIQNDPEAIILINSDHGMFSENWTLSYKEWPEAAIHERLGNLNAMRLPVSCEHLFYDTISPVNYFELIFSCLEDREPNFLEDRNYATSFDHADKNYGRIWRYR